jgi:hypothetical protein
MKSYSIVPSLFLLASFAASAFASESCTCNGLAANFPGYWLICDGKGVDRTPFFDFDENLAERVCEAALTKRLGGAVQSEDGLCICADDVNTGHVLLRTFVGEWRDQLHAYAYNGAPGSRNEAWGACQGQLSELERVGICTNPR